MRWDEVLNVGLPNLRPLAKDSKNRCALLILECCCCEYLSFELRREIYGLGHSRIVKAGLWTVVFRMNKKWIRESVVWSKVARQPKERENESYWKKSDSKTRKREREKEPKNNEEGGKASSLGPTLILYILTHSEKCILRAPVSR